MNTMKKILLTMTTVALVANGALAAEKIKVLIIDGQNNHNWPEMTKLLKQMLDKAGMFEVTVSTTPEQKKRKKWDTRPPYTEEEGIRTEKEWKVWRPVFEGQDVVLMNFNGPKWPEEVLNSFCSYMENGGRLFTLHATTAALVGSKEFNLMTGLGWRSEKAGDRIYLDDDGKLVRVPKGEGKGTLHPPKWEYTVKVRDPEHPVMKGMPSEWLHATDELWSHMRGPAQNMTILATAFCDSTKGGEKATDKHEPQIWTVDYGKGKIFNISQGHMMEPTDPAMRCVGFQTVVLRGLEWLATGKVTIPIPDNFPAAEKVSVVDL